MAVPKRKGVIMEPIIPRESKLLNSNFLELIPEGMRNKLLHAKVGHFAVLCEKTNSARAKKVSKRGMSMIII